MSNCVISVILPCYNEQGNIEKMCSSIISTIDILKISYEIIIVDDGSHDNTAEVLRKLTDKNSNIKAIHFTRNFGKEAALKAGFSHSSGDAIIPLDADFQDPIWIMPKMFNEWEKGEHKIIAAQRTTRDGDSFLKKLLSITFHKVMKKFSLIEFPENLGDFCLFDRVVIEQINMMQESLLYVKGQYTWTGYSIFCIAYERNEKRDGIPRQNLYKLLSLATVALFSYTRLPLVALLSFGLIGFVAKITESILLEAVATTAIFSIFSLYLYFLLIESKKRPLYIVRETVGF